MPRVFVPNKAAHDYSDAERYGELVFVTMGTQNRYSVNAMYRIWIDALKGSAPEDIIVLTGLNIMCSVGCSIFSVMHKRVNILIWLGGKYMKRELMLTNLLEIDK
jgi:hypothetical protein